MRSPQPSSLRLLMVRTAVQAGQDDFALGQSQQALKEPPRNYEAYILLAGIYSRKGEIKQSILAAKTAQELAPQGCSTLCSPATLHDRAPARYKPGLQPDDPSLMNQLAPYLAGNGGNSDEALALTRRAVERLKGEPYSTDTLAWIYLKKNMTDARAPQIPALWSETIPKRSSFDTTWVRRWRQKGKKGKLAMPC